MNCFTCSLLVAAVAGGICGGVGVVQAGMSNSGQVAQGLDDPNWKYPHMHRALESLHSAKTELQQAEDVFKGHKVEAIAHVDNAIHEVEAGLKEHGDFAAIPGDDARASNLDEHFPHMQHALRNLRDARTELQNADPIFAGHREAALNHANAAIKQLEDGISAAGG